MTAPRPAPPPDTGREPTFPQLRSFCEVARRGGMRAAADALGIAQPTVWKQLRALETTLGAPLVEAHGRGTDLTDAGRLLLELCGPAVGDLAGLGGAFGRRLAGRPRRLTVAATPRVCLEDLPDCLPAFERRHPGVHLQFREVVDGDVAWRVEAGEADVGPGEPAESAGAGTLAQSVCYEIEVVLVVPAGHPLSVGGPPELADFAKYPLLNADGSFPDAGVDAALGRVGAYDVLGRRVGLIFAWTIRRYVQLGFGVGLVGRTGGRSGGPAAGTRELPLGHLFAPLPVHAIVRAGPTPAPVRDGFIAALAEHHRADG